MMKNARTFLIALSLVVSASVQTFQSTHALKKEETQGVDLISKAYHFWGLGLGTPSMLNLLYGYWHQRLGVKVSGFYLPEVNGMEVAFRYRWWDTISWAYYSAVTMGAFSYRDLFGEFNDFRYIGGSMTWAYKSFFIEPGLTFGRGDYDSPKLSLQIGLRTRWIR